MTSGFTHDEIEELLGAYALDAVEPAEAEAVAAHLEGCPRCAREVEMHRRVAAVMANSGGDAPAELWDAIAGRLHDHPEATGGDAPAPLVDLGAARARRRPVLPRVLGGVAAAALVVVAGLGVQVARLDHRVGQLQAASQTRGLDLAAQAAMVDPEARDVALRTATSQPIAEIVVLPTGSAFLVDSRLPALPAGQTYQLWGQVGGKLVSLGLLGNRAAVVAFRVDPSATVTLFAVTAEVAGGVVATTHTPVATGRVVAA